MLPSSKIKISNFQYKIIESSFSGGDTSGETCLHKKEILINRHSDLQTTQDTVLHEAVHALCEDIFEALGNSEDVEKREESFVRLFTPRLLQFVRDNPKWLEFLCQKKRC